jgi:hypothetical protein
LEKSIWTELVLEPEPTEYEAMMAADDDDARQATAMVAEARREGRMGPFQVAHPFRADARRATNP